MIRLIGIAVVLVLVLVMPAVAGRRRTTTHNANWNDVPYGMNCFHPNGPAPQGHLVHFTSQNLKRLREGKVRWARLMLDWRYLEPRKGKYYWRSLERVVKMLNAEKIGISACLYEPPNWAQIHESRYVVRPEDFERFGEAIARKFRDRIAAYEIYNELPTGSKWPQIAVRSTRVYAPIQKAAYRGIKRGDPKAIVLMTGLWQFPQYFLEDMYRDGCKDYFDAVNVHYYLGGDRNPKYPDAFRGDLETVLKQIDYVTKKYGDGDKPIWFTEYGWPATAESQSAPVGEEKMAEYMEYFLTTCMDSGLVEKAFWYVYYLSDGMALWHERKDYKRPAFYVHTRFMEDFPDWRKLPVKPLHYPAPAANAVEVPGGDFEDDSAWTYGKDVKATFEEADPQSGKRYLHLVAEKPDTLVTGEPFALEPDKAYELTGYVRMQGGMKNARYAHAMIHIDLLDGRKRPLGLRGPLHGKKGELSTNYYISDTGGKWYQVHYNIYTTPATRFGRIIVRLGHKDAPRGAADFDNIQVKSLDLGKYDR